MPVAATKAAPRKPEVQAVPQLDALANQNEAIHVRNTLSNIVSLTLRIRGNDEISEFAAKDDPKGGDVMELPSSYLKIAQFRNQLKKGIFEIIDGDNPAVVSAFQAQRDAWHAQQAVKDESDRFVDAQQPKSFSGVQCLGQEGRNQCTEFAVYATNYRDRPPLCSKHSYLSPQFVAEENGKFTNGKPDISWARVSILGR
jgi:hypothetical protein